MGTYSILSFRSFKKASSGIELRLFLFSNLQDKMYQFIHIKIMYSNSSTSLQTENGHDFQLTSIPGQ